MRSACPRMTGRRIPARRSLGAPRRARLRRMIVHPTGRFDNSAAPARHITVRPLSAAMGAEIGGVDLSPLFAIIGLQALALLVPAGMACGSVF